MAQVTIYLDDETDKKAREAAAQAGQSVSAWVGGLIRKKVTSEWPAGFFDDLAAAWKDADPADFEIDYPPQSPTGKAVIYALDTNTVIYLLKAQGRVARRVSECAPADLALPSVVVFELLIPFEKASANRGATARRHRLERFISSVVVVPFGAEEARHAAVVRATLEAAGHPIGPVDNLIAGTALAIGATLVTRNVGEFSRVPGLRVEDWY